MEGVCLEEFDQFFIPLSQKSCYSADPPSAGENVETKMQTTTCFFWIVKLLKGTWESYIVPCKIILIVNSPRN